MLYRRNRYVDPATGRFTQEDPIGLAGGVNLYGFAAGDPVSYSDPYGLCPLWIPQFSAACVLWDAYRARGASGVVDEVAGNAPWASSFQDAKVLFTGTTFTGNRQSRVPAALGMVSPLAGSQIRSVAESIGSGHAFVKHVITKGEYQSLNIGSVQEFTDLVEQVMRNASGADVKHLHGGRSAYWDNATQTVVIYDPNNNDLGTAFRPTNGRAYFNNLK